MLVKDLMTAEVSTIAAGETIRRAALTMRKLCVGSLVVCERERPVGILTDRDIIVRGIAAGCDPDREAVRSVMTPQTFSCSADDAIEVAAALMRNRSVRRLLVIGADEHLLGILSVDDLALVDPALAGEVLEHSVAPERPPRRQLWPWWE